MPVLPATSHNVECAFRVAMDEDYGQMLLYVVAINHVVSYRLLLCSAAATPFPIRREPTYSPQHHPPGSLLFSVCQYKRCLISVLFLLLVEGSQSKKTFRGNAVFFKQQAPRLCPRLLCLISLKASFRHPDSSWWPKAARAGKMDVQALVLQDILCRIIMLWSAAVGQRDSWQQ